MVEMKEPHKTPFDDRNGHSAIKTWESCASVAIVFTMWTLGCIYFGYWLGQGAP